MAPLRLAVAELDRDLPLAGVMSMDSVLDHQRNRNPFFTHGPGSFAVLALILAAIGVYGLISYSVGTETRDWHPYGARRRRTGRAATDPKRGSEDDRDRLRSRFGYGAATAQAFRCDLPRFTYWCAGGFVVVLTAMLMLAAVATYIPAQRAARVSPISVLRNQ